MNDTSGMSRIESVGDLNCQRHQSLTFQRTPRNAVLQGDAVQKLHGDERLPVLLANVVNGADVGVSQREAGLRFALEPGECLRVAGNLLG